MGARSTGEGVEIGIQLTAEATVEVVRAVPVREVSGGGVYELRTSSFRVPLAVRDLVRAAPHGRSLRLTGLVCPGPLTLSWATLGAVAPAQVEELLDDWRHRGVACADRRGGRVAMAWTAGVAGRDVRRLLAADLAAGRLRELVVHEPDDRTDDALAAATA